MKDEWMDGGGERDIHNPRSEETATNTGLEGGATSTCVKRAPAELPKTRAVPIKRWALVIFVLAIIFILFVILAMLPTDFRRIETGNNWINPL